MMKRSDAQRYIALMVRGLQKFRSNSFETGISEDILATLHPEKFGERGKRLLGTLQRMSENDNLTPLDFYNAHTLGITKLPDVLPFADLGWMLDEEPDMGLLKDGWEPEERRDRWML